MRWSLALTALAVLASGCIMPDSSTSATPNLLGYCPQWVQGPGQFTEVQELDTAKSQATAQIHPPTIVFEGHPLDIYRVHINRIEVAGGHLELRAKVEDNGTTERNIFDFRQNPTRNLPSVSFTGGQNETDHDFDVILNALAQSTTPRSFPVTLQWTFLADVQGSGHAKVDYTVTNHYRVCGAPL